MMESRITILILLAAFCSLAMAFEPSPLQDFCVADFTSAARMNGHACMGPDLVEPTHFAYSGLHMPGNTSNPLGSSVTPVTVGQLPGLNTLGIALARIDYAPWGVVSPHMHPPASEILTVVDGSIEVGFVTSAPENRLISKLLQKGDVFVFPMGMVHYQRNVENWSAVSLSGLSSQNPGIVTVANSVFGSSPDIVDEILAKAFQVDKSVVVQIQANF